MSHDEALKSRVETLSDRQRHCLRLVGRGLTSKEIAIEIGLTPQTVDTYIKSAMAKLDVPSRRDAARALLAFEKGLSQQLGLPPEPIANGPFDKHLGSTAKRRNLLETLALPPIGGRYNELSVARRTYAVLRVAGTSVVVISSLVLLIAGVMMTFR